jgi:hypothetical protein
LLLLLLAMSTNSSDKRRWTSSSVKTHKDQLASKWRTAEVRKLAAADGVKLPAAAAAKPWGLMVPEPPNKSSDCLLLLVVVLVFDHRAQVVRRRMASRAGIVRCCGDTFSKKKPTI